MSEQNLQLDKLGWTSQFPFNFLSILCISLSHPIALTRITWRICFHAPEISLHVAVGWDFTSTTAAVVGALWTRRGWAQTRFSSWCMQRSTASSAIHHLTHQWKSHGPIDAKRICGKLWLLLCAVAVRRSCEDYYIRCDWWTETHSPLDSMTTRTGMNWLTWCHQADDRACVSEFQQCKPPLFCTCWIDHQSSSRLECNAISPWHAAEYNNDSASTSSDSARASYAVAIDSCPFKWCWLFSFACCVYS